MKDQQACPALLPVHSHIVQGCFLKGGQHSLHSEDALCL